LPRWVMGSSIMTKSLPTWKDPSDPARL